MSNGKIISKKILLLKLRTDIQMESSRIFKNATLVIFSTFFTLIMISIEKRDFNLISNQVVSGFISNSILNILKVNFFS